MALADAAPASYWLDRPDRPARTAPLDGSTQADLVVVGGGFTGLWTALLAVEEDPDRDVVIVEADQCGAAASGRNGGFASASLTHGLPNGVARWPDEMDQLERLGRDNLAALVDTVDRLGIPASVERTGELTVAVADWQLADLAELSALAARYGHRVVELDRAGVRAQVDSPTYLGGVWLPEATVMVDPARLAWGLRRACLDRGVRIYEQTPVRRLERAGAGVRVGTSSGVVEARTAMLATNAFPPLLARLRHLTVPVYDHVLATEPLPGDVRAALGWANRQGVADAGNQFHYYRLTDDDRLVWGGYDAVYHYGSRIDRSLEWRTSTFTMLVDQLFATFPVLAEAGVRIGHAWAGVIDTSTRFTAYTGGAWGGRVAYALGFTGLGVAASRFAAQTALDRLAGRATERTGLTMNRRPPVPFPPEPARWAGITATRWALARADASAGRRNGWLRTLDRLGLGFDS
jgi:glycine/D-amino acid oxidase-like deaminating enzyme